jgi:hypothetical protein
MPTYRNIPQLLTAALTLCLLLLFGGGMSPADAGVRRCLTIEVFAANLAGQGGSSTPIPAAGFSKARALLKQAPKHPSADAAFLEVMANGSSGIIFAKKGCISAIWPAPAFVPTAKLKAMFVEGKQFDALKGDAITSHWVSGLAAE